MKWLPLAYEGEFSLSDTLKSGQLFHWEPIQVDGISAFAGCIGDAPPTIIFQDASGGVFSLDPEVEKVRRYFGLDHRINEIHDTFPRGDEVLSRAIAYCPGIRIVRQPMWECLATFITSSLKQVTHIRAISMTLRERYGKPHEFRGRTFYAYPEPGAFASAGEDALRECALGYRAKSLRLAGEVIAAGGMDLEALESSNDEALIRESLMQLHGVGEKIANCVTLFSAGQWGAFPIDVWIERILREHYRKRLKGPKLQAWAVKYFGENAGYAQQYLFHFARKTL